MRALVRSIGTWCLVLLTGILGARILAPSLGSSLFPEAGPESQPRQRLPDEQTARREVEEVLQEWGMPPLGDGPLTLPAGRDGRALEAALRRRPALQGADVYVTPADDLLDRLRIRAGGRSLLQWDLRPWLAERPLVPLDAPPAFALVVVAGQAPLGKVLRWTSPTAVVLPPWEGHSTRRAKELTQANKEVLVQLDPREADLAGQLRAIPEVGGAWLSAEPTASAAKDLLEAVAAQGLYLVDARAPGSPPLPASGEGPAVLRLATAIDAPDGPRLARHLARRRGAAIVSAGPDSTDLLADFVATARQDGYVLRFPSEISRLPPPRGP